MSHPGQAGQALWRLKLVVIWLPALQSYLLVKVQGHSQWPRTHSSVPVVCQKYTTAVQEAMRLAGWHFAVPLVCCLPALFHGSPRFISRSEALWRSNVTLSSQSSGREVGFRTGIAWIYFSCFSTSEQVKRRETILYEITIYIMYFKSITRMDNKEQGISAK